MASERTCEACSEVTTDWYLHPIQQVYICWECVAALGWKVQRIDGSDG